MSVEIDLFLLVKMQKGIDSFFFGRSDSFFPKSVPGGYVKKNLSRFSFLERTSPYYRGWSA